MKALVLKTWDEELDWDLDLENDPKNYIDCELLAYDRDKYILIRFPDGREEEYKSGYIRNAKNFKYLTYRQLYSLPIFSWGSDKKVGTKPTKRDVQKELREHYKIKTTFKLYYIDNNNNDGRKSVRTLNAAIKLFRKYPTSRLLVNVGRWNVIGIAEQDSTKKDKVTYDVDRKGRPTYSAKALTELCK